MPRICRVLVLRVLASASATGIRRRSRSAHLKHGIRPWSSDLEGAAIEVLGAAFSIKGSLSLRTVLTGADPSPTTATEVLLHMETHRRPDARRALIRARLVIREGLSRLAAVYGGGRHDESMWSGRSRRRSPATR